MEFYHRKDLSKPPFNLILSDAELWDLVKAGKLQPFMELPRGLKYDPPDALSEDPNYQAIFPGPYQEKYEQFQWLRETIFSSEKILSENTDEAWKVKAENKLVANREEARRLEMEFKDIPKLYEKFIKDSRSDTARKYFVEQLNDAYYRREQIEALMEQPKKKKAGARSKSTEAIYIAAAERAIIELQDMIKHNILPQTREKKLEALKTKKKFQKAIAALPRKVNEKYLIRKLNEVRPGIWKLGESSNKRDQNKKYRPKSLYS